MGNYEPLPGETVWHGHREYTTCRDCSKMVQMNKRGVGGLHLCLSAYDRAVKYSQIATKEDVALLLEYWDKTESLLREVGVGFKIRNAQGMKVLRLVKKLNRRKNLSSDVGEICEDIYKIRMYLRKGYNKGYQLEQWITPLTANSLNNAISSLNALLHQGKNPVR